MPADGIRAIGWRQRRFGTPVSVARHKAYPELRDNGKTVDLPVMAGPRSLSCQRLQYRPCRIAQQLEEFGLRGRALPFMS
jgi:hypothetical protein